MKYLLLGCKGFIIGVAKIIPGVSGAIIAIAFGVYENLIRIISKPLKIKIKDLQFLFCLLVGAALGIGLLCKGVSWCLEKHYLPTMLLFIGLIIGGIPEITMEIKNKKNRWSGLTVFALCFTFLYYLIHLQASNNISDTNYWIFFLIGIIEALTTIIPGVSGTAIFMALGWYEIVLSIYENMSSFSIDGSVLVLFLAGFIISTILVSKVINWLFRHYKTESYYGVLGFMGASLLIMFENILSQSFSFWEVFVGGVLLGGGIWITQRINVFFSKL